MLDLTVTDFRRLKLIKRMTRLCLRMVVMIGATLIFSSFVRSEPEKIEPQFKYLITGGPGAGQMVVGDPPRLVFTGKVKYYDTPEDAFLEYPDFIERSVLTGGEITFVRVSNFRVDPKSAIVNGNYDSYCWDLYREINGVSVEPLTCTGGVWMKPFCPTQYHLSHAYHREGNRFIHHYDCVLGEKPESSNSQTLKKQEPEKQKPKP